MIAELRRAVEAVGHTKGLNDHQLENVGAILILNHYKHAIPDFEEKDWYISEITRDGELREEYFTRRKMTKRQQIKDFMDKHIIVR